MHQAFALDARADAESLHQAHGGLLKDSRAYARNHVVTAAKLQHHEIDVRLVQ